MSNGKVNIQDLVSEDVFMILKPEFLSLLKSQAKVGNSFPKISIKLGISKRILQRSLSGESAMRLDILVKILQLTDLTMADVTANITALRGLSGGEFPNPKFPIDFTTTSGVKLVAAILGDGCLDNRHRIFYANTNPDLVNGFIQDIRAVFGNGIKYAINTSKDAKQIQIVELSPLYGMIISKVGLKCGKKVETNPVIPEFIFNLNEEKISEFISQLFDDEGCVNLVAGHLKISFNLIKSEKESNLVRGLERLFLKSGVFTSIYKREVYTPSGKDRNQWHIQICGGTQIKKLNTTLNFRHNEKRIKLEKLAASFKSYPYLKRNCTRIYLDCMEGIVKEKNYFTSEDLTQPLQRKIGHIRNMLHKYLNKKLISQIEPAGLTWRGAYPAKYIVNHEILNRPSHS